MSRITRRVFLKASALLGVTLALGKYMSTKTLSFTELCNPAHAAQGKAKRVVPAVSDVDAHSQCRMRVDVQGGKVTTIGGDPTDPESKGQLPKSFSIDTSFPLPYTSFTLSGGAHRNRCCHGHAHQWLCPLCNRIYPRYYGQLLHGFYDCYATLIQWWHYCYHNEENGSFVEPIESWNRKKCLSQARIVFRHIARELATLRRFYDAKSRNLRTEVCWALF